MQTYFLSNLVIIGVDIGGYCVRLHYKLYQVSCASEGLLIYSAETPEYANHKSSTACFQKLNKKRRICLSITASAAL